MIINDVRNNLKYAFKFFMSSINLKTKNDMEARKIKKKLKF